MLSQLDPPTGVSAPDSPALHSRSASPSSAMLLALEYYTAQQQ